MLTIVGECDQQLFGMKPAERLGRQCGIVGDRQLIAHASAVLSDTPDANRNKAADRARTEDARRAAKKTAWSTLISLALAIGAASVAGVVGAKDDQSEPRVRNPRSGASERPEVR